MLIKRKVYFSAIDEETGEERLFSADSIITEEEYLKLYSETLEQREYGAKSKALGLLAPGSYQAKEAAKYGYDNKEDYKKKRAGYANSKRLGKKYEKQGKETLTDVLGRRKQASEDFNKWLAKKKKEAKNGNSKK